MRDPNRSTLPFDDTPMIAKYRNHHPRARARLEQHDTL
jgi:hypothetical protein